MSILHAASCQLIKVIKFCTCYKNLTNTVFHGFVKVNFFPIKSNCLAKDKKKSDFFCPWRLVNCEETISVGSLLF